MKDYKNSIKEYFARLKNTVDQLNLEQINEVMNVLMQAYEDESTVYICGNGGSASTASHYMNDFNKGLCYNLEKKFRFECINDNIATMMAIANDDSYDVIFSKQLEGKMKKSDYLIGISGSGNSKNVINAVKYANAIGAKVIGISGYDGGELYKLSDYHLHVNIKDMQVVEDIHMIFDHMMMKIFYNNLVNKINSGENI